MRHLAVATLLAVIVWPSGAAPPAELGKLHVLMAFDTADPHLGKGLGIDQRRLTKVLQGLIPASRYEVTVLSGKGLTGDALFERIRSLRTKVTPRDGVFFFFGGHGAINDKLGHVLKFHDGKVVKRQDVRRQLLGLKAGLTVILTDCCSTKEKYEGERDDIVTPRAATALEPTAAHLFFQARGVVDITAATEEEAWSDDDNGGLFTRSLCRLLVRPVKEMDLNGDGFLTWAEFFPQLQRETQLFFRDWSAKMKARYSDSAIRAETQKPYAFFLGKQQAYAVVEVENARGSPLAYRFRWEGQKEWTAWELKAGARKAHAAMLDEKADGMPRLELWRAGAARPDKLAPVRWEEDRAPRSLPKRYRIMK
jgi:hypothetical protein